MDKFAPQWFKLLHHSQKKNRFPPKYIFDTRGQWSGGRSKNFPLDDEAKGGFNFGINRYYQSCALPSCHNQLPHDVLWKISVVFMKRDGALRINIIPSEELLWGVCCLTTPRAMCSHRACVSLGFIYNIRKMYVVTHLKINYPRNAY